MCEPLRAVWMVSDTRMIIDAQDDGRAEIGNYARRKNYGICEDGEPSNRSKNVVC